MQKHTDIYYKAFGYDRGDFIPCEVCRAKSMATHHIEARKMGGRPLNNLDRIENLMAICRECDILYGDKKAYKAMLFRQHARVMESKGITFDSGWINEMIKKHE
jgi:hypothetical protein